MNKNLRQDTKELKKYHNWLEAHQEYASSQTYHLRNMLENIRFVHRDILKLDEVNAS